MEEIYMCNECGFQGELDDFGHDDWKNIYYCTECGSEEIMNTESGSLYIPARW